MSEDDSIDAKGRRSRRTPQSNVRDEHDTKLWGILIFGLIGATFTTFAVGQLRRSVDWFASQAAFKATAGGSSRSTFQEEARKRYARRLKEEYEEEMERVERIRRMQSAFNREKNKYKRSYDRWRNGSSGESYQHFQWGDWYWKGNTTYGNWSNFNEPPQAPAYYSLSHHYAILGLSRSRTMPYTDDEIKAAFRSKAKQYHPDQNQENKEVAEARFKEVMASYEAIKSERKNMR